MVQSKVFSGLAAGHTGATAKTWGLCEVFASLSSKLAEIVFFKYFNEKSHGHMITAHMSDVF